jgi:hypothetical protein
LRGSAAARSERIANYKIDARLDPARHQVAATQTLHWTNTGQTPVSYLPFHLYLNAFKNDRSLFWRTSRGQMRGARASEGGWGWIDIESVQLDGAERVDSLRLPNDVGDDETVVELPLLQPVQPGQAIEVSFRFTAQLPEVFARTGYKGEFHMVAQWFPKIGVRTGIPGLEQWKCEAHRVTSEFFSNFGTYDVSLTVPSTYVVAATGVLTSATESPGGTRTLVYRAEDVHDFAWMADPYMREMKGVATVADGAVHVSVWYRPEQEHFALRHLRAGIGAIETFSRDYLPYPWSQMTIIDPPTDAALAAGGMEYPTLVTTGGDSVFAQPGVYVPEYTTVHEVGHSWFQGLLASNEAEEAWLDEGINEWATMRAMAQLYGTRTSGLNAFGIQADLTALRLALGSDLTELPVAIATAGSGFVDVNAYADAVYDAAMRMLTTLEREFGSKRLVAAIREYVKAFAFRHPTERDFATTLEAQFGENLDWFFAPALHQVGGVQLKIRSAGCRPAHPKRGVVGAGLQKKVLAESEAPETGSWTCEVVVQNSGAVHVPVDIALHFRDGSTQRLRWDDRGGRHWQRFEIERSSQLVAVQLDPEGKVALASPIGKRYRLIGDSAASLRAAARAASWTQTLMQLVGP